MSSVSATAIAYTPSTIEDQMIGNIRTDESAQAGWEEELSSGAKINAPSDDPTGAADVLRLGSGLARAAQYQANATDGQAWLSTGTTTVDSIVSILQSVQQSAGSVSGVALAGGTSNLQAIAASVSGAAQQILALANTTYNGQAIFAGTGNVTQAYNSAGVYVGGGSAPTRTVGPSTQVAVAVTGTAVFGSGASGLLGASGVLATLAKDISTGTPASLAQATTTDLTALSTALAQVESQASALGTNYQQMTAYSAQATATTAALTAQLSGTDSTDLAQASTDLTEANNSYQSGLWAISQIQQDSLVQYLS